MEYVGIPQLVNKINSFENYINKYSMSCRTRQFWTWRSHIVAINSLFLVCRSSIQITWLVRKNGHVYLTKNIIIFYTTKKIKKYHRYIYLPNAEIFMGSGKGQIRSKHLHIKSLTWKDLWYLRFRPTRRRLPKYNSIFTSG